MNISKVVMLMGDRLRLSFFVDEDNYYRVSRVMVWFEDDSGKDILGDNYDYYIDESNKKEIKSELQEHFPGEKGLYKELKQLLDKMKEYEYKPF